MEDQFLTQDVANYLPKGILSQTGTRNYDLTRVYISPAEYISIALIQTNCS